MTVDDATTAVTMGFVPRSVAVADVDHPGLLRAGPRASAPYARDNLEQHLCPASDMSQDDAKKQSDLVQKATDEAVTEIDKIVAAKEQEILQV